MTLTPPPTLDPPAGASKFSSAEQNPAESAATGNGASAQALTDAAPMAAHLPPSPAATSARPNTGTAKRRSQVSLADRLQIAQQAMIDLELAGVTISILADGTDLVITLHQVAVADGDLISTQATP